MTERGLPLAEGASACPFVAFEDDRDERASVPDHRHRCYAETRPAPRALAHQQAYCLSSAFPVCPTFQDWARREAAHARGAGEQAQTAPTATPTATEADLYAGWSIPPTEPDPDDPPTADVDAHVPGPGDEPIQRNPPRDWAAPPPWATGQSGTSGSGRPPTPAGGDVSAADPAATRHTESQGLAGSPADRLAAGEVPAAVAWSASAAGSAHSAPDDELAGLVQGRSTGAGSDTPAGSPPPPPVTSRPTGDGYPPSTRSGKRPAVSSTRDSIAGPSWERLQRYEAYPTIKRGSSMRGLPRIAVFAGALGIAALALFMLPALLGIGGGGNPASASPSGRAASTASALPTAVPAPTALVYVIKKNDTLSKVANKFDVELADLLAANPEIKDPNKISLGQEIIIPTPAAATPVASEDPAVSTAPE